MSLHAIGLRLHSHFSRFPHLGQLQSQSNNEALQPTHFVYSAKSSLIEYIYDTMKIKCVINILKICLIFNIYSK